jgi:hypothetical protein
MTKFHALSLTTVIATALASSAFADGVTYSSVELSYTDVENFDATVLTGEVDYVLNQWSFTGALSFADTDSNETTSVEVTAGYAFTSNLTGYVELGYAEDDFDDATLYGIGAEYQTADYGVALEYNTFDEQDVDLVTLGGFYSFGTSTVYATISDDETDTSYLLGLTKAYNNLDLDVATVWTEDFDTGLTTAAVDYDLGNNFSLTAALFTLNDDFLSDGIVSVGGSYQINEAVSAEAYVGTGYGDIDADVFGLELEFEVGKRRLRVLDQVEDFFEASTILEDISFSNASR